MMNHRPLTTDVDPQRTTSPAGAPVAQSDMAAANRRLLDCMEDMLATRRNGKAQPHGKAQPQQQPEPERQSQAPRHTPRVLCIDDDPDYVRAVQVRLESCGIAVSRATSGLDGFCSAVGERADAILLDYQLPNGCGDFVLQQLKVNPATKGIPVIVISGSKDRALEHTLINGGAVGFLHKPLDFEKLMSELRKYLPVSSREGRRQPDQTEMLSLGGSGEAL
jgi:two-component system, OmpR family, response regulator RpaA